MSIRFPITIKIIHEEEAVEAPYVAYIPEFDISSCGKTEKQAVKNAKEALEITLEEAKKADNLEILLKEAGVSSKKSNLPKLILQPFVFHC